jgi:hypothetical protein
MPSFTNKDNSHPSRHQELKKVSGDNPNVLSFHRHATTKEVATISRFVDQSKKKLHEHANANILLSTGSQSDTETVPTVDTSTIDSFLNQTQTGEYLEIKEIQPRPPQGRSGNKSGENLPLPSRSHYPLPPPRYRRSTSMEGNVLESSQQRAKTNTVHIGAAVSSNQVGKEMNRPHNILARQAIGK